jgi:hypothetical protein
MSRVRIKDAVLQKKISMERALEVECKVLQENSLLKGVTALDRRLQHRKTSLKGFASMR